jgi:hypothetical protein
MTAVKRTGRWGIGGIRGIRNWRAGLHSSRDMARRYSMLARLANLDLIRRGFSRPILPSVARV